MFSLVVVVVGREGGGEGDALLSGTQTVQTLPVGRAGVGSRQRRLPPLLQCQERL